MPQKADATIRRPMSSQWSRCSTGEIQKSAVTSTTTTESAVRIAPAANATVYFAAITRSRRGAARKVCVIVPCRYSQVTIRIPRISAKITPVVATVITSNVTISSGLGTKSGPPPLALEPAPSTSSATSASTRPSSVRGAVRTFSASA
jgi:hypothetical protein